LVLACSETGQTVIELVLGEPEADQRHEVIYRDGIPMLRPRPAGESAVTPWPDQALTLPLHPPGEPGQDRLSLQFSINDDAELTVEWRDLGVADRTQQEATGKQVLALGMVR
jgi:hypothetical protein